MNTNYVAVRRQHDPHLCCFDFSEIKVNLLAQCEYKLKYNVNINVNFLVCSCKHNSYCSIIYGNTVTAINSLLKQYDVT